jgi:RNA polymerase sigma factor (sigma-70 family)
MVSAGVVRQQAWSADSVSTMSPAPASDLARLVRRAGAGDHRAWTLLVERLGPKLRATARRFRLSPADVEDVVQSTWLAAYRNIAQLSRPESFEAWIDSTARRVALRLLQQGVREVVTSDLPHLAAPADDCPEPKLIERETSDALHAAVRRLPRRQRQLVDALLQAGEPSYGELCESLRMPIGSIGPTRQRAVDRLRRDHDLLNLVD